MKTTIGGYLIQRLQEHGVAHVFGVPGDFVLTFMHQIEDSPLRLITTCDEQGAGFAADAYARLNRRPPAEADMQRYFGVTPPSVHQMILTLERAGLIQRRPGVPRSVEVLVPPEDLPALQADNQPVKTSVTRY